MFIRGLLSILFTVAPVIPAPARKQRDARPDLPARARAFVSQLVKKDFAGATRDFDAVMRKAMPADKLEETWKALLAQVGAFQTHKATRTEYIAKYDVVFVTCAFAKASLDVKLVFTDRGEITGLFFVPTRGAEPAYQAPPYVRRATFREIDVTVGADPWKLPGTLSLPVGKRRARLSSLSTAPGREIAMRALGPIDRFVTWPGAWHRAASRCCATTRGRWSIAAKWPACMG